MVILIKIGIRLNEVLEYWIKYEIITIFSMLKGRMLDER